MTTLFVWTFRGLLLVAGLVLIVPVWQTLGAAALEIGSGAPGPMTMVLRASRLFAIGLAPISLIALFLLPRLWRFALLPIVWAVVATILIYPRELDFLF